MNRLAEETSPYLRQHRDNPVDWYPWGEEAFAKARAQERPVLLSVGYSACHWCHVMAHESFEDEATAAVINQAFVAVKVDREERPDVDAIYMEALQALTGQGGWPMTVFLTPAGQPFYAGTYFPKQDRHGLPGFVKILRAIDQLWRDKRPEVLVQAQAMTRAMASAARISASGASAPGVSAATVAGQVDAHPGERGEREGGEVPGGGGRRWEDLVRRTRSGLLDAYDRAWGGFGRAPKFPQPSNLEVLIRALSGRPEAEAVTTTLEAVTTTLDAMASGGLYEHLGGGFHRYSVDERWLVPHFEKMLYDQAGLARAYLHAWQVTGEQRWLQVVEETIAYVGRDLASAHGGVCSAEDADSEGEEGRFYVWRPEELTSVLGSDLAARAVEWYGVTEAGNFEGANILHRPVRGDLLRPPDIERARAALFEARSRRPRPGLDDKVLTEWNAMWCSTLAEAAGATGRADWRSSAVRVADFLCSALRREGDGRWLRSWQGGRARQLAYAADYAWLADAFTRLGELCGQARWVALARESADALLELFWDAEEGGLFTTGHDAEKLVVRAKDTVDGATPSANSVAALALARLGALTGEVRYTEAAWSILDLFAGLATRAPTAFTHLLCAADLLGRGATEVAVVGDRPDLVAAAARRYRPKAVLAWGEPYPSPLWEGRQPGRAYVCRGYACQEPVDTVDALEAQLG